MTTPDNYQNRTDTNIPAMLCTISIEDTNAIVEWIRPFFSENAQFDQPVFYGRADGVRVIDGETNFTILVDQYVYHDEDGLHTVNKDVFEFLKKKVSGS